VRNKTGWGSVGISHQEGSQTLKVERSGQAKPAASGPAILKCAEGKKSPREEPIGCGRAARLS
jgi:hypothetical protein